MTPPATTSPRAPGDRRDRDPDRGPPPEPRHHRLRPAAIRPAAGRGRFDLRSACGAEPCSPGRRPCAGPDLRAVLRRRCRAATCGAHRERCERRAHPRDRHEHRRRRRHGMDRRRDRNDLRGPALTVTPRSCAGPRDAAGDHRQGRGPAVVGKTVSGARLRIPVPGLQVPSLASPTPTTRSGGFEPSAWPCPRSARG
jgi:hypothetical protein